MTCLHPSLLSFKWLKPVLVFEFMIGLIIFFSHKTKDPSKIIQDKLIKILLTT